MTSSNKNKLASILQENWINPPTSSGQQGSRSPAGKFIAGQTDISQTPELTNDQMLKLKKYIKDSSEKKKFTLTNDENERSPVAALKLRVGSHLN